MDNHSSIKKAAEAIRNADHILIGAGAGLSEASGIEMAGRIFQENFGDYREKYGIQDLYSGGFYPFSTQEEFWAFWARHIWLSRYRAGGTKLHEDLHKLVQEKDYFVLSTNCDSQFTLSGFPEGKVFEIQGDLGEFQCSKPCHQEVYSNQDAVKEMVRESKDFRIPTRLIPHCPVCGRPMTVHLRMDDRFTEDDEWHRKYDSYSTFVKNSLNENFVLLELGVGFNTPGIIRFPFEKMAAEKRNITLIRINSNDVNCNYARPQNLLPIQMDLKGAITEICAEANEIL